jgi:hypothetical protein
VGVYDDEDDERDVFSWALSESAWVAGVDYLKGWADARAAAEELRAELARLGWAPDVVIAAGTGAEGAGVVRLMAEPDVVRCVVSALRQVQRPLWAGRDAVVGKCAGFGGD